MPAAPAPGIASLQPGAAPRAPFATLCALSEDFARAAHCTGGMELVDMSRMLELLCSVTGHPVFRPLGELVAANRPDGGTQEDVELLVNALDPMLICNFTVGGGYASIAIIELLGWSNVKRRYFVAMYGSTMEVRTRAYVFTTT